MIVMNDNGSKWSKLSNYMSQAEYLNERVQGKRYPGIFETGIIAEISFTGKLENCIEADGPPCLMLFFNTYQITPLVDTSLRQIKIINLKN